MFGQSVMVKQLRPVLVMFCALTLVTGVLYPLAVTGIAQSIFSRQANGSLLGNEDKPVGSELIGQAFADPKYFWGRPSATAPYPDNAAASSGSNLGPTNPALVEVIKARIKLLRDADPEQHAPIPVDLVTASASGIDPQISLAAAQYQVSRVARVRGLTQEAVAELVTRYTQSRQFGFLGESRVNVLKLNLALDAQK